MCGIVGFLRSGALLAEDEARLRAMADAITHRGPDGNGLWLDAPEGVALGHRRLAIIDLSSAGSQPMVSASGRYVIIYNGEIYNHRDLRVELEAAGAAPVWRGHSDTEVMLAAFDRWGLSGALERLNGMFAFAVWDRKRHVLTLARDRLGEKPLYYGRMGDAFLFGSELKALSLHPAFERNVDRDALTAFLRYNYVPAPHSIWRGISKLPPAHLLEVSAGGSKVGEPTPYWDFREAAERGAADPLPDGPNLAADLETLLKDAVLRRMEADVPLGAFLSGGIDSSLIVALMQAQSSRPVKTFAIGFTKRGFNEAVHAKAVAAHLGTDHREFYVTTQDALDLIPRLPAIWDEPFSDSSQIPTYLVSALARRHVTVSLSGDGGDELFGGYNRYVSGMRLWEAGHALPAAARRTMRSALSHPASARAANALMSIMPTRYRQLGLVDRLPKIGQMLGESDREGAYRRLVSHAMDPERIVLGGREPAGLLERVRPDFPDFRQTMMYADLLTYLPDDILAKVDRATMAVSLEARVPYLDHRVVEYAWRLPMSAKIRGGKGKHILREMLYRHVPRRLLERPKMGFAVPIGDWLRGPLRGWAEELLSEARLENEGFFAPGPIRKMWAAHVTGKGSWHHHLWDVLMFQAWWAEHGGASAALAEPPRRRLRA